MADFESGWRGTVEEWLARLPEGGRMRYVTAFRHGSLEVELYAPKGVDQQTPHTRDELYIVAAGSGEFMANGTRTPFGAGDVLFVPAGMEHRFEAFTAHFATWVMFYGPEGGEMPPRSDFWRGTVRDWLETPPAPDSETQGALRHGSLEVKLYTPRRHDPQFPHKRDELYVVARGRGRAVIGNAHTTFGPADAIFVPAGMAHHFEDFSSDFAIWVMFYGPEGGETAEREAAPAAAPGQGER
jgi:mannose-6-phosphate isomerase-like protein (cupin superfamily)